MILSLLLDSRSSRGWSGLAAGGMPEGVYAAGFLPHAWLLPRAACVVHHGGAQSSAAVFRAGVPAVVVPHVRDQPIWAELSRRFELPGWTLGRGPVLDKSITPMRSFVSAPMRATSAASSRGSGCGGRRRR